MDTGSQRHTAEEVKMMDMVSYLSGLGYEPSKVRNADYWYRSPFREEHEPSFKVNRKLNRWYDHGLGKGGTLIDFGIRYHNCSVGEFLHMVGSDLSFHQPLVHRHMDKEKEHKIIVTKDAPLTSFQLLKYLEQRKIPIVLAGQFCREVSYSLEGKNYYGIGFRNDSGGYELRNPYFKASSSPKDVTTFANGNSEVKVFEGFMDFLSYRTAEKEKASDTSFIVLNSLSFFDRARAFMEQHDTIKLYLDNDQAGQNYSSKALSLSDRYKDESRLYEGYKDVNEWLADGGKSRKKRPRQRL